MREPQRLRGLPGRENCGTCHFFGGGGDGVKHGDLDSSLTHPGRDLNVHMNAEGLMPLHDVAQHRKVSIACLALYFCSRVVGRNATWRTGFRTQ